MSDSAAARALSRSLAALVVLASLALLVAGCGWARHGAGGPTEVRITERDFRIDAPQELRAGDYRFLVHNGGPDTHEFIVVRERGSQLPLHRDGLTVDEDGLKPFEAGALEPGGPGSSRSLTVHLTPGRYVLFCNMMGHYLGGMHTTLVVR